MFIRFYLLLFLSIAFQTPVKTEISFKKKKKRKIRKQDRMSPLKSMKAFQVLLMVILGINKQCSHYKTAACEVNQRGAYDSFFFFVLLKVYNKY